MKNLNIGFIGGCINRQQGLSRQQHYYAILRKQLTTQHTDLNCSISLAVYLSVAQLSDLAIQFIDQKKPHVLGLFIRPFAMLPFFKPLIKYESEQGKVNWSIHPKLNKHNTCWETEFTRYLTERPYEFRARNKFELRDVNLGLGMLLGLENWAHQYIIHQIAIIRKRTIAQNIHLIIISPPPNPESFMGNRICKRLAPVLKQFCDQQSIPFLNIYPIFAESQFKKDKIHLNEDGHFTLAHSIIKELNKTKTFSH